MHGANYWVFLIESTVMSATFKCFDLCHEFNLRVRRNPFKTGGGTAKDAEANCPLVEKFKDQEAIMKVFLNGLGRCRYG